MREIIAVEVSEVTGHAVTIEDVAASYDNFEIDASGVSAQQTGHVELADNLPGFAEFLGEIVDALAGNASSFALGLRGTVEDMCVQEEAVSDALNSIELPSFHGDGQVAQ